MGYASSAAAAEQAARPTTSVVGHTGQAAVNFLDSLSAGKPEVAPAAAFVVAKHHAHHISSSSATAASKPASAQLAEDMARATAVAGERVGLPQLPGARTLAQAYGVEKSLRREEDLARSHQQQHGPYGAGVPFSGWRKTLELEEKLRAAKADMAATKLQVEQLRGEGRRKTARIGQLESLVTQLEEANRGLTARLRSLDCADGVTPFREPLPAAAVAEVDAAVATAAAHSRSSQRLHKQRAAAASVAGGAGGDHDGNVFGGFMDFLDGDAGGAAAEDAEGGGGGAAAAENDDCEWRDETGGGDGVATDDDDDDDDDADADAGEHAYGERGGPGVAARSPSCPSAAAAAVAACGACGGGGRCG